MAKSYCKKSAIKISGGFREEALRIHLRRCAHVTRGYAVRRAGRREPLSRQHILPLSSPSSVLPGIIIT